MRMMEVWYSYKSRNKMDYEKERDKVPSFFSNGLFCNYLNIRLEERRAGVLTILIDTTSKEPIYEQIYKYIREEITNGNIACGTKLPSSRGMAAHLEVSRNTVDMAYGQLLSEGYIESSPKRGYYVCALDALYAEGIEVLQKEEGEQGELLERAGESKTVEQTMQYVVDFSPSGVDMTCFPYGKWRKLMKECLIDDKKELFLAGNHQGELSLRRAVQNYLHQSRGVSCDISQIIIGAGSDYMLLLLTRILGEGQKAAIENPGYRQAYTILNSVGYPVVPIAVDEQGIQVEALEASGANLVYVTPSHQFPLGTVLSASRRQALLAWAQKEENRYIIEDDYDSEFRYFGKPIPALQSQDPFGKVIYIGTLSKAIAPGIRISYMVLPKILLQQYVDNAGFYYSTVSRIDQQVLGQFFLQGHFERHLNRMRKIYRAKHDVLLNAIKSTNLPVEVVGDSAGLHVLLRFPNCESEQEEWLISQAAQCGVKVYGLSEYDIFQNGWLPCPTLILGFAKLTEKEIIEGVNLLQKAWMS